MIRILSPAVLERRCCCGHAYGEHSVRDAHRCLETRCACTGFRRPLTSRDLPDCWNGRGLFKDGPTAVASATAHPIFAQVGANNFDISGE